MFTGRQKAKPISRAAMAAAAVLLCVSRLGSRPAHHTTTPAPATPLPLHAVPRASHSAPAYTPLPPTRGLARPAFRAPASLCARVHAAPGYHWRTGKRKPVSRQLAARRGNFLGYPGSGYQPPGPVPSIRVRRIWVRALTGPLIRDMRRRLKGRPATWATGSISTTIFPSRSRSGCCAATPASTGSLPKSSSG